MLSSVSLSFPLLSTFHKEISVSPSPSCREVFLSSGDVDSYQSVRDNMAAALPVLSGSVQAELFSLTLPVPPPLETRGRQVGLSADSSFRFNTRSLII